MELNKKISAKTAIQINNNCHKEIIIYCVYINTYPSLCFRGGATDGVFVGGMGLQLYNTCVGGA